MSTEKVYNQLKQMGQNTDILPHKIISALANGIKTKIDSTIQEDLNLRIGGKSVQGSTITLQITGSIVTDNENGDQIKDSVRQIVDLLRNPDNLLDVLE